MEHAAELADSNMKMLAHARAGGKMPTQDFKRAQALLVSVAVRHPCITTVQRQHYRRFTSLSLALGTSQTASERALQNKDAVKGRCWLTEMDLKKSTLLRPDKTGKAILTILRHVGRLSEVSSQSLI